MCNVYQCLLWRNEGKPLQQYVMAIIFRRRNKPYGWRALRPSAAREIGDWRGVHMRHIGAVASCRESKNSIMPGNVP